MSSIENIDTTQAEVNRRFEAVRQRYAQRLSSEELEAVREDVKSLVEAANELRAVRLAGSVEPFSVFVPYRSDD